jgi:glycosyltransferase involved in cell wall biosynthesis
LNPKKSKIKYLAPTERVAERLKLYGVKKENIFFTGFPLPLENIGFEKKEILKSDLENRLVNLDPQKKYFSRYSVIVEEKLGQLPEKSDHPLTITFCVGGAGAQKEIGAEILESLKEQIKESKIKIILVAGIREKVRDFFLKKIKTTGTENGTEIIFSENIDDYFREFNLALRKTDILWTKPSELSFYSALGLPVIIAPTIGSQEEFNRRWLLKSGFGLNQENPNDVQDWLFDWLNNGYLAEAAMQGFIEGSQLGTLEINKIASK